MELTKLTLHNFKGIKSFTFEPGGESVDVFGANETGKTTLFDGLTWLLTGKDSRDRSPDNFGIKTRDPEGEVLHGIDHEVEGVFDCVTLRRVYQEKWTRRRGSSKETFSGHTTDYYIDGVPVKASEYQDKVEEIIPENLLKMLTMPDYFADQMHWTDRREVLFDLVGEINDEDIIKNYGGLDRYPEVLGARTHEQQEKVLKARKRDLNKELDNIPSRIDENSRMIEEVEGVTEAKEKIITLGKKKETIAAKLSEVKSGGVVADLKVQKQELEAKKGELRAEFQQKDQEALSGIRDKVSTLQDKVDEAESDWRDAKRGYENAESAVKQLESVRKNVESDIQQIKDLEPKAASAFEPEKCPVCERPYEDAEEHDYEQYLEEFNQQKATDLKEAKEELGQAEQDLIEAKKAFDQARQNASKVKGRLTQRKDALEKAQSALQEAKQNRPAFESTDEFGEILDQIAAVEEKMHNHREEKQRQIDQLNEEIDKLDAEISEAQKTVHQAEQNEKIKKRIAELQADRKEVATELDQVEADLHLMEEFVRARSAYVTNRVNDKFEHVSWRLFKEQINGGVEECCDAIYKGVPFDEGLNNAGRIQAGLDIINTLSKHYEKAAPVFVDNAESVSSLPETDLQVIRLVVSPEHKKLTVESKKELAVA